MQNDQDEFSWNLQVMARTIYATCLSENEDMLCAIAAVITNRAICSLKYGTGERWGWTPSQVCLKSGEFKCWTPDTELYRVASSVNLGHFAFFEAYRVALSAICGYAPDPSQGAHHFSPDATEPEAENKLYKTAVIEGTTFWREYPYENEGFMDPEASP